MTILLTESAKRMVRLSKLGKLDAVGGEFAGACVRGSACLKLDWDVLGCAVLIGPV
jgi:hypothetical protein